MGKSRRRAISLTPETEKLISALLDSGRYESAGDAVAAGLRAIQSEHVAEGPGRGLEDWAPRAVDLISPVEGLERLMDFIPAPILLSSDSECKTVRGNRAVYELCRLAPQSNLAAGAGTGFRFFRNSRELRADELAMQRAAASGEPQIEAELEVELPGQRRIAITGAALPLFGEEGQVAGAIGSFVDITEGRRAAEALRESEARLRLALENGRIGMWSFDVRTARIECIALDREIFGAGPDVVFSAEEWFERAHPADREAVKAAWGRSAADGSPISLEYRVVSPSGEIRWVSTIGKSECDSRGRARRLLGIATDVTDRRRAEEALREREGQLCVALGAGRMGTWVWDVTTGMVLTDRLDRRLWDMENDETYQSFESLMRRVHPDDRFEFNSGRLAQLHGPFDMEFRVLLRDGRTRWLHSSAAPVRNSQGAVEKLIVVNFDVSERRCADAEREQLLESERAARADAERASRLKDEFLSTVSHELRTPLNGILGWAQVLLRSVGDNGMLREGLTAVERNAWAQVRLIEDLLDMGRIMLGKVRMDAQPIDANEVLDGAAALVRPLLEQKSIELRKEVGAAAAPIIGDLHRLQQVVCNLLNNAAKFTPSGGRITMGLAVGGDHIEISVADTGIGIRKDFLPYVFDRFRQGDSSSTRRHGGLGLGLAIVKNLVDLHGGRVSAFSAGEGKGATFRVMLPRRASAQEESISNKGESGFAGLARARSFSDLKGLRILVVDDVTDTRELLVRILQDCGARAVGAAGAEEALKLLERDRPDLLLSDISMPLIDGYELMRRVRRLDKDRGGETPAIALTAFTREEDRAKAIHAGFQLHMAKPVKPTELILAIRNLTAKDSEAECAAADEAALAANG